MGQFLNCGDLSYIESMFADLGTALDIPVCSGLPVGHGEDNITLPMGLPAELDTINRSLSVMTEISTSDGDESNF